MLRQLFFFFSGFCCGSGLYNGAFWGLRVQAEGKGKCFCLSLAYYLLLVAEGLLPPWGFLLTREVGPCPAMEKYEVLPKGSGPVRWEGGGCSLVGGVSGPGGLHGCGEGFVA